LAIEPNTLEGIIALLEDREAGITISAEDAEALRASQSYGAARNLNGGSPRASQVALIGLYGPMMLHTGPLEALSGATGTREFAALVRAAADDPNVAEIVLDVDSPGGTVDSVDVAVAAVRYAAERKPVTAVTEGLMASAAYWVASQATKVVASENSQVGSISVLWRHVDQSGANEKAGVKVTTLATGDKKAVGDRNGPLSEAGTAEMMRLMTAHHEAFVADVAKGRGITADRVQRDWADGRVETGAIAARIGLVDEVGTLASVLDGVTRPQGQSTPVGQARINTAKGGEMKLSEVLKVLRDGDRVGAAVDTPEGARTLTMTDTVAMAMASAVEEAQTKLDVLAASEAKAEQSGSQFAAQLEARKAAARQALTDAALEPFSVESDALFAQVLESAAESALDDTSARVAVTGLIADRKALLAATRGRSDNHPSLPKPGADKAQERAAAALTRIRRSTGLN
jgi:signal peptide peptidase SppA